MRATVALGYIVCEGEHMLVIRVVPPKSGFDDDLIALTIDQHRVRDERSLGAIEVTHESFKPAIIVELLAFDLGAAKIGELDTYARIQESQFSQAMFDNRVVKVDHAKGLWRWHESYFRAAPGLSVKFRRRP
jgi:hypothetical protein